MRPRTPPPFPLPPPRSLGIRLLVLKYEDLQQQTGASLQEMLRFVGEDKLAEDSARINCAIDMSNQKSIHRVKKITAEAVWRNQTDTACGVWHMITKAPASRLLLTSLGYTNMIDPTGEVCAARRRASAGKKAYGYGSHAAIFSTGHTSFYENDCTYKFDQSAGMGRTC